MLMTFSAGAMSVGLAKLTQRGPARLRRMLPSPATGTFAHSMRQFLLLYFLVAALPLIMLFIVLAFHPKLN
jgi:hypothetical protein